MTGWERLAKSLESERRTLEGDRDPGDEDDGGWYRQLQRTIESMAERELASRPPRQPFELPTHVSGSVPIGFAAEPLPSGSVCLLDPMTGAVTLCRSRGGAQ